MEKRFSLTSFLIIFCLTSSFCLHALEYSVSINGIEDKELVSRMQDVSQTFALKNKPPTTFQKLKRRAEGDIPALIDMAHYYGYYSAKVQLVIKRTEKPEVLFRCDLGPLYQLGSFYVLPAELDRAIEASIEQQKLPVPFNTIEAKDFNLYLGKPARTQQIIDSERSIVWHFKKKGYAFAKIVRKEIVADATSCTIAVRFYVNEGPVVQFGKLHISGNTTVHNSAIEKNIFWKEGEIYDPEKIEKTQTNLEKSGLFSSLVIDEDKEKSHDNILPMDLEVQESKHRSIGAGINYTTSYGPGVTAGWENRNFRGEGETLSLTAELWKIYQTVILSWTRPHFRRFDQNLVWQTQYQKLKTLAFDMNSETFSAIIERQVSNSTSLTVGNSIERLLSKSFEGDRLYYLYKVPLQVIWSCADNLLDPTRGVTANVKATPAYQVYKKEFAYMVHTSILSCYHSFFKDKLTLAVKGMLGNIFGASREIIPPPDRFYAGSDITLRGYRYLTVSPLWKKKIPVGGRSLLTGSIETRFRFESGLGWVFFYDVGNVYGTNFPVVRSKQLHAVGTGVRYTTPIGPLRFDIAFPVNPRPHIDPPFQIYFSIGQAF